MPYRAAHRGRDALRRRGGTTYYFVTDGIDSTLAQAKAAAGDKAVAVIGGANIIQEVFAAGLVDELRVRVAPVVLGAGTRLFDHLTPERLELEAVGVSESAGTAHLIFEIRPAR